MSLITGNQYLQVTEEVTYLKQKNKIQNYCESNGERGGQLVKKRHQEITSC